MVHKRWLHLLLHNSLPFPPRPINLYGSSLFLSALFLSLHHLFKNAQEDKCLFRISACVGFFLLRFGRFYLRTNPSCSSSPSGLKIYIRIPVRFFCAACRNIGRSRETDLRLSVNFRTFPRKPWRKGVSP